ncbi:MAG: hypothetical protein WD226_09225 [Planctomycetota bacterium]
MGRTLLAGCCAAPLLAVALGAQATVVAVGDVIATANAVPVGTLASVTAHAVTSPTSYTIHGVLAGAPANTDEILFGPDGLFLREGDPVPMPNPTGAAITGFGTIAQDTAGRLAYIVKGGMTAVGGAYEALYFGPRQILRTGTSAAGVGFGGEAVYADIVSFKLARGSNSCSARFLVRVDVDTPGGLFEALIDIESGCGVVENPARVLAVGDTLCTQPTCTAQTGPIFDLADTQDGYAINASGDVLVACSLFTLQGIAGAVARNGVVDACDLCTICGGPLVWGEVGRQLALSDDGTRAVRGNLVGGDEVLLMDGCVVAQRVGLAPTGLPGPLTSLGRVFLAEDGVPFWFGAWTDPDPAGGVAIFRGDTPVVQRGVTVVDGSAVWRILDSPGAFCATGRSGFVAFGGELVDGTTGVFVVPTAPPVVASSIVQVPGCYSLNTATLTQTGGSARIGDVFLMGLDQAQVAGAVPQLFFANRAIVTPFDPLTDCGLTWVFGEVILGLGGPNPVFGPIGAPWTGVGPSQLALGAPLDAINLIGQTWYVQGMFIDVQGLTSNEPLRTTNALAVTFGSP